MLLFFLHFVYLHYSRNQLFQLTHLPCCTENTGCLGDEMIESILKQIIQGNANIFHVWFLIDLCPGRRKCLLYHLVKQLV